MRFIPHTPSEVQHMLEVIGAPDLESLFQSIPEPLRLGRALDLTPALGEQQLSDELTALAEANTNSATHDWFLGAGTYPHFIPAAIDSLASRAEFLTAYTPYQPEISQGTLQAIFEWQTMISSLVGLEVANASMYDGASASAEAALMAMRLTRRSKLVVAHGMHPHFLEVLRTYVGGLGAEVRVAKASASGLSTPLDALVDDATACVLVQRPNFYGCIEDLEPLAELAHARGALLVTVVGEALSLALLQPPGAAGADIVCGEAQSFGVPMSFGGPHLGFLATGKKQLRQLPGRLVGQTVDSHKRRGFVLTLATREQHIRRERATSNICTNHGLVALAFTIRTAMLGRRGFAEVGRLCLSRAEYLKQRIDELDHFSVVRGAPTFNEFVVRREAGKAAPLLAALAAKGVLAGVDLGRFFPERENEFLVAVTERHDRAALDRLVEALGSL